MFIPETIGSLVYLSRNLDGLKSRVEAGFNVTCVGDERAVSFVPSRLGGTLADRVALNVLQHHAPGFVRYSFLDRGSDERQYCSPGVDLPMVSILRSKYGTYPEYHTSADDLAFITAAGLGRSLELHRTCLRVLEGNRTYRAVMPGEPQLGRRGLYPTLSRRGSASAVRVMMDFLAYCDGHHDLIAIADRIGCAADSLVEVADRLSASGVIECVA